MIPSVNNLLLTEINEEDMPSKNYRMISESVRGTVDTIEAMKQHHHAPASCTRGRHIRF